MVSNTYRESKITIIPTILDGKIYHNLEPEVFSIYSTHAQNPEFLIYRVRAELTPKLTLIFSHKKYK